MQGALIRAQNDGNDLRVAAPRVEASLAQPIAQDAPQLAASRCARSIGAANDADGGAHLRRQIRRQSGAENKGARAIDQKLLERFRAANERAHPGERFAARMHGGEDALACASAAADKTAPLRAEDAGRVRFVHDEFGAVAIRERDQIRQSARGRHPC